MKKISLFLISLFVLLFSFIISAAEQDTSIFIDIIDDSETDKITYFGSGWTVLSQKENRYKKTLHSGYTIGMGYEFTAADCTRIQIFGWRASYAGKMEICLDGEKTFAVDTNNGKNGEVTQTLLWDSGYIPRGEHTIRVTHMSKEWVELDYIVTECDTLAPNTSIMDDTSGEITYNRFSAFKNQAYLYNGTVHSALAGDAYYEFSVIDTRQVEIYGDCGVNRGKLDFYIDGVYDKTVDLYSRTTVPTALIYVSPILDEGTHTIKVTKSASSNGAATANQEWVTFDYAKRRTYMKSYQFDQHSFAFTGSWTSFSNLDTTQYINGDCLSSYLAGSTAEFSVKGAKRLQFYSSCKYDRCNADIYINGEKVATVTQYSDSYIKEKLLFDSGLLKTDITTVKFVIKGESGNPDRAEANNWFEVDKITVWSDDSVTPIISSGNNQFFRYDNGVKTVTDATAVGGTYTSLTHGQSAYVTACGKELRFYALNASDAIGTVTVDGVTYDFNSAADECFFKAQLSEDKMHTIEIHVLSGELKLNYLVTDDENLTTVSFEMRRLALAEMAEKKAGTWQTSSPEAWVRQNYTANSPVNGVHLLDGALKVAFDNNISYIKKCYAKENYVDSSSSWITVLTGSNYGRMLGAAGNALRFTNDAELSAIVDDIVGIVKSNQQESGYLMPYDESYMGGNSDSFYDERRAYDVANLTKGLLSAGYAKELSGTPAADNEAYTLLRDFYDWWGTNEKAKEYGRNILKGHLGVQGMPGFTKMYLSSIGQPQDLLCAEKYFVQNWWMEYLSKGVVESIYRFPINRPHCYLTTVVDSYFDMYMATGDVRYLEACKGYYEMNVENFMHKGGIAAICEHTEYSPKSYHLDTIYHTGETCGSVFFIELSQKFLNLYPTNEMYAANIEQALYNVILASQVGDTGIRYHNRMNGTLNLAKNINHCCEVNATPLIARLPEFVFSVSSDAVYVNLYEPAMIETVVSGKEASVRIDGSTLAEDPITVTVSGDIANLYLRIPSYAADKKVTFYINGIATTAERGTYTKLENVADGSVITMEFGKKLESSLYEGATQVEGKERYCFMKGSVLYAVKSTNNARYDYKRTVHGKASANNDEYAIDLDMSKNKFIRGLVQNSDGTFAYTEKGERIYDLVPYNSIKDGEFFSIYPLFNPPVLGDVTADDALSLLDVLRVLKDISNVPTINTDIADMDGDSDVDLADALLILKKIVSNK